MSKPRANIARESVPPLIFMPEHGFGRRNFPIIPFQPRSDDEYWKYLRRCENRLSETYRLLPEIGLEHDVVLSIMRANITKRREHAATLMEPVVPGYVGDDIEVEDDDIDMRGVVLPDARLDNHFDHFVVSPASSIEVGFRFVGGESLFTAAFDDRQVGLNHLIAGEFLGDEAYPEYSDERTRWFKVTRTIGELAVVKTKLKGPILAGVDGAYKIQSRGRRTGVVDLSMVDGDVGLALRILAGAGADQSLDESTRDYFRSIVDEYLEGKAATGYRAVFERYYFTREDVSEELSR